MGRTASPDVLNLAMPTADQQYSVQIPAGVRSFTVQGRQPVATRLAFVTGKVDTASPVGPFWTIKSNQMYSFTVPDPLASYDITLYLACGSVNQTIEVALEKLGG